MDTPRLDQEISKLLEHDLSHKSYSDLSQELQAKGYSQMERRYIMEALEEKVLIPQAESKIQPNYQLKIILGSVLGVISLLTVSSLYFGQSATREIYYVALAVFALGYYLLRSGLKEKRALKDSDRS